jgi:hypothetical protein
VSRRQNLKLTDEIEFELPPRNLFSQCFSQDTFLSLNAPTEDHQLSDSGTSKLSSRSRNYKKLLESWAVLNSEVEQSKLILNGRLEELSLEERQKIERRYELFLKKYERITS